MIGVAKIIQGLYHLLQHSTYFTFSQISSCNINSKQSPFLWHCRLDHLFASRIQLIKSSLSDSDLVHSNTPSPCAICHLSKQKKLPFLNSISHSPVLFHLIHCDIWGPFPIHSHYGFLYFLTIVDDYSRCT